jgi:hypothetical protein
LEPEEALIPESPRIALPSMSRWFVAGVVLLAAFAACGFLFARTPGGSDFPADLMRVIYVNATLYTIALALPALLAIAMVWIGFARPQWSDRLMWSAAMVLTSAELTPLASLPFRIEGHGVWPFPHYPSAELVSGFLAYSCLFFVVAPCAAEGRRIPLAIIGGAALVALIAFAPLTRSIRYIDFAGSLLFAATLFAFGVALAEQLGINLFRREQSEGSA